MIYQKQLKEDIKRRDKRIEELNSKLGEMEEDRWVRLGAYLLHLDRVD